MGVVLESVGLEVVVMDGRQSGVGSHVPSLAMKTCILHPSARLVSPALAGA